MIELVIWAAVVLGACVLLRRRHNTDAGWTWATGAAFVTLVAVAGETITSGRAGLLLPPAIAGVFVALPYLTVAAVLVVVGPHVAARARATRPWRWAIIGWCVWSVLLTPVLVPFLVR